MMDTEALTMRAVIAFLLVTVAAVAETPELLLERTVDAAGKPAIRLRNVHVVAATAWRCASDNSPSGGSNTGADAAMRGSTVLAPGAEIETRFSSNDVANIDCAVVYADGSTAGDPLYVDGILENRRATLRAIPGLRALIVEALANHETVQTLREKVQQRVEAQQTGRFILPQNAAAITIWMALRDAVSVAAVAPDLIAKLDVMRAALEASKPSL
jgi:hypothetical protein